jgi:hypothetical protein
MRDQDWVVTFKVETRQGTSITEFYRGSRNECLRIKEMSTSGGSDDQQATRGWRAIAGLAQEWDDFIDHESPVEVFAVAMMGR